MLVHTHWAILSKVYFIWPSGADLAVCTVIRNCCHHLYANWYVPFKKSVVLILQPKLNILHKEYIAISEWGCVGYEEFCWSRPRWITTSEICRILHISRKLNSIIALLFIQDISLFLKEFCHFALCFSAHQTATQSYPQVFMVSSSIICSGLHFWHHFDIISSIICSGLHFWRHWFNMTKILFKFGQQQLVMVNYARGFNQ